MANKFTKSVLERQAKEMKVHAAQTSAPEPEPAPQTAAAPEPAPASVYEEPAEPAPAPAAKPAVKKAVQSKSVPDLTDFIVRDEGRTAKNKTFYLDAAVIDGVHRAAVAQKVTDSKLVNDILKKILGL